MRVLTIGLILATTLALPAAASERTGYREIASGDWQAAERTILMQGDRLARRPELMLNLAAIYVATGRDAEAVALYRAVQDQPAVAMDVAKGGVVSSHVVATRGMARLAPMVAGR